MMSNSFLFSKIILISILFFQTFCKNNQRFFRIMSLFHLQLSKSICLYFHEALNTFSILFLVKYMPPERVYIAVSLVIGLTVNTFETV